MLHAEPTVTRLLRAAVKVGDDYYTIEETISLQPGATERQIQEAVATGLRIYEAQRAAVEAQIQELRSRAVAGPLQMRDPDAPASDKQRQYMDYLLKELRWDTDRLGAFAAGRKLNLLTLTKREASELIDELKGELAGVNQESRDYVADAAAMDAASAGSGQDAPPDEGPRLFDDEQPAPQQRQIPIAERATQRQLRALDRLVDERGIDLASELRARFGDRQLTDLSMDEAGQLLSEWQQRPRVYRPQQSAQARRT